MLLDRQVKKINLKVDLEMVDFPHITPSNFKKFFFVVETNNFIMEERMATIQNLSNIDKSGHCLWFSDMIIASLQRVELYE